VSRVVRCEVRSRGKTAAKQKKKGLWWTASGAEWKNSAHPVDRTANWCIGGCWFTLADEGGPTTELRSMPGSRRSLFGSYLSTPSLSPMTMFNQVGYLSTWQFFKANSMKLSMVMYTLTESCWIEFKVQNPIRGLRTSYYKCHIYYFFFCPRRPPLWPNAFACLLSQTMQRESCPKVDILTC
jgi:hypothetical protein